MLPEPPFESDESDRAVCDLCGRERTLNPRSWLPTLSRTGTMVADSGLEATLDLASCISSRKGDCVALVGDAERGLSVSLDGLGVFRRSVPLNRLSGVVIEPEESVRSNVCPRPRRSLLEKEVVILDGELDVVLMFAVS